MENLNATANENQCQTVLGLQAYMHKRFSSAEEMGFLHTEQYKYYAGYDPDDGPAQIRIDKQQLKLFYRFLTDDTWIEEQTQPVPPSSEHRELMETIADRLRGIFQENNVWQDATIYFNGQAYVSGEDEGVDEYVDSTDYVAHANPNTVTVTYEGPLKTAMNHGEYNTDTGTTEWTVCMNVQSMLRSYGYYMVINTSGNFTIYPQ